MDPATIMSIVSALATIGGGLTGEKGKMGSTYSKKARSKIDEILDSLSGMKGAQDVTQNPQFQQGQNWLTGLFNDPEFFKNFEAPIQRQFEEQTVPDLANRFASMGSGGSLGSTGFRNQLAREGSNLSTNIAALRGGMQQQAIPQLMGYAQQPFQNYLQLLQSALQPTQNIYQPPSTGFLGGIAPSLISATGQMYANQPGQNQQQAGRFPGQNPATV